MACNRQTASIAMLVSIVLLTAACAPGTEPIDAGAIDDAGTMDDAGTIDDAGTTEPDCTWTGTTPPPIGSGDAGPLALADDCDTLAPLAASLSPLPVPFRQEGIAGPRDIGDPFTATPDGMCGAPLASAADAVMAFRIESPAVAMLALRSLDSFGQVRLSLATSGCGACSACLDVPLIGQTFATLQPGTYVIHGAWTDTRPITTTSLTLEPAATLQDTSCASPLALNLPDDRTEFLVPVGPDVPVTRTFSFTLPAATNIYASIEFLNDAGAATVAVQRTCGDDSDAVFTFNGAGRFVSMDAGPLFDRGTFSPIEAGTYFVRITASTATKYRFNLVSQ